MTLQNEGVFKKAYLLTLLTFPFVLRESERKKERKSWLRGTIYLLPSKKGEIPFPQCPEEAIWLYFKMYRYTILHELQIELAPSLQI